MPRVHQGWRCHSRISPIPRDSNPNLEFAQSHSSGHLLPKCAAIKSQTLNIPPQSPRECATFPQEGRDLATLGQGVLDACGNNLTKSDAAITYGGSES
jgi:hypothetical protein